MVSPRHHVSHSACADELTRERIFCPRPQTLHPFHHINRGRVSIHTHMQGFLGSSLHPSAVWLFPLQLEGSLLGGGWWAQGSGRQWEDPPEGYTNSSKCGGRGDCSHLKVGQGAVGTQLSQAVFHAPVSGPNKLTGSQDWMAVCLPKKSNNTIFPMSVSCLVES